MSAGRETGEAQLQQQQHEPDACFASRSGAAPIQSLTLPVHLSLSLLSASCCKTGRSGSSLSLPAVEPRQQRRTSIDSLFFANTDCNTSFPPQTTTTSLSFSHIYSSLVLFGPLSLSSLLPYPFLPVSNAHSNTWTLSHSFVLWPDLATNGKYKG